MLSWDAAPDTTALKLCRRPCSGSPDKRSLQSQGWTILDVDWARRRGPCFAGARFAQFSGMAIGRGLPVLSWSTDLATLAYNRYLLLPRSILCSRLEAAISVKKRHPGRDDTYIRNYRAMAGRLSPNWP